MAIRILSETVVDQIAAGEVLERPAHLVKELIENSIDALATEIEVEFDQGGRFVRVQDNGAGIAKDELALALTRFATSKISNSDDLFNLSSYGFRGEALASISAVSKTTITSRTPQDEVAHRITSEFGSVGPVAALAAPAGTGISVEKLFENVPARLKFLKSEAGENAQIRQVIKAIALARPDIQFRVRSKGELLYFWKACSDWKDRAEEVLEFKPLIRAEGEENGIQVRALIGSPDQTLRQNRGIWIFVQDRWIQDRALTVAILEAYRNLLMHGEYPHAVLSLHVPNDNVDVNVHPTKSQVKFVDSQPVFRAVVHTLRETLETAPWVPAERCAAPFASDVASNADALQKRAAHPEEAPSMPRFRDPAFSTVQYQKKIFPLAEVKEAIATYSAPVANESTASPQVFWGSLEIVGQAHLTYIVAQSQEEFYLIDQHAAHERIVFERLMAQWKSGRFDTQNLLLPLMLDLPAHEMEGMEKEFEQLQSFGLRLEKMGPETLAIGSIPSFVSESAVVNAIKELASEMSEHGGSFAWEKKAGDIFASMACHSVVRAGQTLSHEEMRNLLRQMDEFPLSSFCPHGRPVSVRWGFTELERKFGRIV